MVPHADWQYLKIGVGQKTQKITHSLNISDLQAFQKQKR